VLLRAGRHLVSAPLNIPTLPRPTSEPCRSSRSEDLYASASILAPKNKNFGTSLHGGNIQQPLARLARPGLSTFSKCIFSRWRMEGVQLNSTPSILHPEKYPGKRRKPRTGQTCANTDRSAEILIGLIKQCILLGTTIISDCWEAYSSLREEGYTHHTGSFYRVCGRDVCIINFNANVSKC
jgi:hypothetical protein